MASDIQNDSTMQMACGEREDFADLLAGLSPDQWEQDVVLVTEHATSCGSTG